jgi:DNA-binding response OmpR family regulator
MPIRVLIVEDHEPTRLALAALLRQAAMWVRAVGDGASALETLRVEHFDVVLSDIWMDAVDGIAVLRAARAQAAAPAVILLTGSSTVATSVAALRLGAFDYLEKPFDPAALIERVQRAAEQRAANLRQQDALQLLGRIADMVRPNSAEASAVPEELRLPHDAIHIGRLQIGADRRAVYLDDAALSLTPIEFAILRRLADAHGAAVSVEELALRSHGYALSNVEARTLLKPHISNLRRKLPPGSIISAPNASYRLEDPTTPR